MTRREHDLRYDVTQLTKPDAVRHIIMREETQSLCGELNVIDQPVHYVGVWDGGKPPNCDTCKKAWQVLKRAAVKAGQFG